MRVCNTPEGRHPAHGVINNKELLIWQQKPAQWYGSAALLETESPQLATSSVRPRPGWGFGSALTTAINRSSAAGMSTIKYKSAEERKYFPTAINPTSL